MKRLLLISLIFTACQQTKQNVLSQKEPIDSFIRQMNKRINQYWDRELWDSAGLYLRALKDTVGRVKDDRLTFYWHLQKVQHQLSTNNRFDSASFFMNQSLRLLKSKRINYKDSFNLYVIYLDLLKSQNLNDSALRIGNEAYYLVRNDSFRVSKISLELAEVYAAIDDLSNMRKYSFKAWDLKDNSRELINKIAQMILYYYDRTNRVDSALYFLTIMERNPATWSDQPAAIASLYETGGLLLVKKGRPLEGLQQQLKAKKILDSLEIKNSTFYNNLADTYGVLGKLGEAFTFIDSAIAVASTENDFRSLSLAWRTKSELLFKNLQYKKAYSALDSSYTYFSEDADSSLRKHARELETKYAVREKDHQINTLALTNEAHVKVRHQQKITIFTIIAASLFLAIIAVLLWRRRQTQMVLRENNLKQQLLRAQMDPHFLFNALAILQSMIRSGDAEQAITYLNALAKLMRFNFENAKENYIPLEDEIEALDAYLSLQTIYRPGLFQYRMDVYENYRKDLLLIPPMLLQPFIENAIMHGFDNLPYEGKIAITIKKSATALHCVIEDNGKGLLRSHTDRKTHSTQINQERLSILAKQTGTPTTLTITDKGSEDKGHGVHVELVIPLLFQAK
jgi:hypothetical protein